MSSLGKISLLLGLLRSDLPCVQIYFFEWALLASRLKWSALGTEFYLCMLRFGPNRNAIFTINLSTAPV
jgi:hypothetical protein